MNGTVPGIFISSTCYDLTQVRADIKIYLEDNKYHPFLSEFNSFPIDPNLKTTENCFRAIEKNADILILLIGGRYWSQVSESKSITNLEYQRARIKGIPIYVFVLKNVYNTLSIWKENKDANFNSIVDNNKIFDFILEIKESEDLWIFPFETAQDIIITLKTQFAILFKDSLKMRSQLQEFHNKKIINKISPNALRLIIEKPSLWEYLFYSQILSDEIFNESDLRKDLDENILFGNGKSIYNISELSNWLRDKLSILTDANSKLMKLHNDVLPRALGKPGEPSDLQELIYVTNRMGDYYRSIIEWVIEIRRVLTEDEWKKILELTSNFGISLLNDIERYCTYLDKELKDGIKTYETIKKPISIEIKLVLNEIDTLKFDLELKRLEKQFL